MTTDPQTHWQEVYASKSEAELSWYEARPALSLHIIDALNLPKSAAIADIGAGASHLVDALLVRNFAHVTVVDIAQEALDTARARLGKPASRVNWVASDIVRWKPAAASLDIWHDRAAFHFLTEAKDRAAYCATIHRALKPGGHAIIAGFAPDGPERCSGMKVMRHDAADLIRQLGHDFSLCRSERHTHHTPWHSAQQFQYNVLRKRGP
jgi:SAM-dependent methyltransferase